ncbi:ParB/RepB/Spo0J family partition protein [Deinococcus antarcticus]|uniref:ParB/RepB/Spo0J family partition protein n=1 Tax=Deinococcus antarcticus TaxID=1298767 RepID=A0ABV8A449_9DEIO
MSKTKPNPAMQAAIARAQKAQNGIQAAEVRHVPVDYLRLEQIESSPYQARKDFQNIEELAEDIRANGVLQPVLVRPLGHDRYQLVAGERRWRASKLSEQATIPAVIREMTDLEARTHGLRENLQREDLNAYELARAVVELVAVQTGRPVQEVQAELGGASPTGETLDVLEEALQLVNKELTYLSFRRNYLALLRLPEQLVSAIEQGASYSAVLALRAATEKEQKEWLPRVISGEWSRRQIQQAIAQRQREQVPTPDMGEVNWKKQIQVLNQQLTPERLSKLKPSQSKQAQKLLDALAKLLQESHEGSA